MSDHYVYGKRKHSFFENAAFDRGGQTQNEGPRTWLEGGLQGSVRGPSSSRRYSGVHL